ncbi:hypothetical protein RchiOBHm_Chr7g0238701 [Rosa chinensis]|uniref:Uncharacterized protein n=1 Tax=Rosa chinensis TaxID=74649 RepID=A0A2P6PHJ5_ROSCH|nr:hypothetical protein RchiOBHm_Chr7g0238701 [Rosa chinensis]
MQTLAFSLQSSSSTTFSPATKVLNNDGKKLHRCLLLQLNDSEPATTQTHNQRRRRHQPLPPQRAHLSQFSYEIVVSEVQTTPILRYLHI